MNQRGILAGAPSLHIYKDEANNEREFYLEGKMYHKGCPARHSDPLSNLKNINSTSLSKNSITNYYAVDTFLEEGNPSVCTVVSITLFSLMDDIYEMPQTQEPPFHGSPSARKLQIPWETFSEKLAENTADRKRFHSSFALHCFFFGGRGRKKPVRFKALISYPSLSEPKSICNALQTRMNSERWGSIFKSCSADLFLILRFIKWIPAVAPELSNMYSTCYVWHDHVLEFSCI